MSDQIDIFNDLDCNNDNKLKVIENNKENRNYNFFRCYRSELKEIENKTLEELFYGFDNIQVITFSYNIDFISKIMKNFKHGEIILGAEHIYLKDNKMSEICATLAYPQEASMKVSKYSNLVNMMLAGNLKFHVSTDIVDHRKIYILSTDDKKRTRVITTSANFSKKAWMETRWR